MRILLILLFVAMAMVSSVIVAEEQSAKAPGQEVTLDFSGLAPMYTGKVMSLDVQDADMQAVLNVLAAVSKLNFIVAPEVRGNVTISVKDTPWDEVFHTLMKTYNLHFKKDGNIVIITRP